jgi:heme exporter protein A
VTGPNGSGKSTLLRVLAGLIAPAAGAVQWQGAAVAEDMQAHRARLHYVGHLDAVKPSLTVAELLAYWSVMQGIGSVDQKCLEALGIKHLADHPLRRLSAGQKRRVALTRLVLTSAPLWLLDEPLTALDRDGQGMLAALITQHRATGGIVIAASHEEIAAADSQVVTLTGAA